MMKILRNRVPLAAVEQALNHIRKRPDLRGWSEICYDKEIVQLLDFLPPEDGNYRAQIVWHEQDIDERSYPAHTDRYRKIIGVALTCSDECNGGIQFENDGKFSKLELTPGDVVIFGPTDVHRTGTNSEKDPRVMVYFRFSNRGEEFGVQPLTQ